MNPSEIKFRCSSLGFLMTEPRSKADKEAGNLSETAKTHCVDVFVSAMYGRREEVHNKFIEKGNEREEDSITLLSRISKIFFKKNSVRLENDFISGTPDIFRGKEEDSQLWSIINAKETFDTKTSWSANTFFRAKFSELPVNYYWQGTGYMWLTGATQHTVAFCLVNGTPQAILDEKHRLMWRMGIIDETTANETFFEKVRQIEINHIFDLKHFLQENPGFDLQHKPEDWNYDIPMEKRLHTFTFERNEDEIKMIAQKVMKARIYILENLL